MPAANIEINGVAASNVDVTINTTVNLTNADVGGEATYLWEIIDQPDGAADTITNPTQEAASIVVRKEGTYHLRLTVNQGQGGNERVDSKVIGVLDLKTGDRYPAAAETTQTGVTGWKNDTTGLNRVLRRHAAAVADPQVVSAVAQSSGLGAGDIVKFTSRQVIKSGLPGEEHLLGVEEALATTVLTGTLAVVVGTARPGGSNAIGNVLRVRVGGLVATSSSGSPAVGDPVYVSDTGVASLTPGTNPKQIGRVVAASGGSYHWMIDTVQVAPASGADVYGDRELIVPIRDFSIISGAVGGTHNGYQRVEVTGASQLTWGPLNLRVGERLKSLKVRTIKNATGVMTVGFQSSTDGGGMTPVGGTATSNTAGLQTISHTASSPQTSAFGINHYVTISLPQAGDQITQITATVDKIA